MIELAARSETLRPDQVAARTKAFDAAKASAKGGDAAGASAKLAAFNQATPNTAEWHMETHGNLIQLADQFSRAGKAADSKTMVAESLKQLDAAERVAKAAGDTAGQARAKLATGRVQERFRGDPVAALASYEAALLLNPNDQGTKEARDRLQRSYQNVLARAASAKPVKK